MLYTVKVGYKVLIKKGKYLKNKFQIFQSKAQRVFLGIMLFMEVDGSLHHPETGSRTKKKKRLPDYFDVIVFVGMSL